MAIFVYYQVFSLRSKVLRRYNSRNDNIGKQSYRLGKQCNEILINNFQTLLISAGAGGGGGGGGGVGAGGG